MIVNFLNIKDETDTTNVEQTENTITISESEFIEIASQTSQQILKGLEEEAKKRGSDINPMMFMSELLTHTLLISRISGELFKKGEK